MQYLSIVICNILGSSIPVSLVGFLKIKFSKKGLFFWLAKRRISYIPYHLGHDFTAICWFAKLRMNLIVYTGLPKKF